MSENKLLWILERTVSKACEWLRRVYGKRGELGAIYKWKELDSTFKVDWEVEKLIINELSRSGLNALIVSEERGVISVGDGKRLDYIILIDPLDGSLNYVAGIPYSSVSIAVAKYRPNATLNDLDIGIIQSVFTGDTYLGVRGRGAYVNGVKLVKEKRRGIEDLSLVLGYLNDGAYNVMLELERHIGMFKFRSLGCASLDLMFVAKGDAALFIDLRSKLRVIDVGAAYVILREMGCIVRDGFDREINPSIATCSRVPSIVVYRDKEVYEKYKFIHELYKKYVIF